MFSSYYQRYFVSLVMMLFRAYIVILGLLLMSVNGLSQRTETVVNFDWNKNHFSFDIENDVLFQSDHYYTGGLAISYTHRYLKHTPAQFILRSKRKENLVYSGFGVEHRLYTPYDISDPLAIPYDRPYSSYFLVSNFSVVINPDKSLKMSNELGLGVLGPAAGGEELQSSVHSLIRTYEPIGWENQLSNSFLIDYQFRLEKGLFGPVFSRYLRPVVGARVGTLKDEVYGGLILSLGNVNAIQASNRLTIASQEDRFAWEFILEADIVGVLYDATLQGGINHLNEPYALSLQEVYSKQYRLRTGMNMYYKGFFLRYMLHYNSRDFTNAKVHHYGGIYFGFSF